MKMKSTMKKSKYDDEIIDIDPAGEYEEQNAGDKDD